MRCRLLETTAELEQAVQVEIAVWGLQPLDAVPTSMLRAVVHGGGALLGALEGDRLVGIALAFPARRGDQLILWSHSTGVLPAFQGRDIGFTLKQKQRDWALANGYSEIGWTFDPLKRGNANFNFHRLGATAQSYLVNFYGAMDDSINAGALSDRLEAIWQLRDPRVVALAAGQPVTTDYPPISSACTILSDRQLQRSSLSSGLPYLFAEVPASAGAVSDQWRLALREALQEAFAAGYTALDFIGAVQRSWIVLRRL
jgi:predicted GNAT superfamily acetyltransferase